jgi:hypothetical protein
LFAVVLGVVIVLSPAILGVESVGLVGRVVAGGIYWLIAVPFFLSWRATRRPKANLKSSLPLVLAGLISLAVGSWGLFIGEDARKPVGLVILVAGLWTLFVPFRGADRAT